MRYATGLETMNLNLFFNLMAFLPILLLLDGGIHSLYLQQVFLYGHVP